MENINIQRIIADACDITNEPLSHVAIENIVTKFENMEDKQLATQIATPENKPNFELQFLKEYEDYFQFVDKQVHICSNLKTTATNSRLDNNKNDDELFVYLHGLGGSLDQFLPLLKLTKYYNNPFIAIDLFGFGQSDELEEYSMVTMVEHINDLIMNILEHYQVNFQNIHLIGHSMGCYLTLHYFNIFQNDWSFTNLTLLSPPAPSVSKLSKDNRLLQCTLKSLFRVPWLFTFYRQWFDQSKGLNSSGIKQFFHPLNVETNDDITLRYLRLFQFYNNIQIKSKSIIGYLLGWIPLNWNKINENFQNSITKVTIITGELDHVTNLENVASFKDAFSIDIDRIKLITIPNCAHNITFDACEQLCRIFIQEYFEHRF